MDHKTYGGRLDDMYGGCRMRLCCHTCSSWRAPPIGIFCSGGYCNDRRNESKSAPENEFEENCEYWKPSRKAIRMALAWNGNPDKQGG